MNKLILTVLLSGIVATPSWAQYTPRGDINLDGKSDLIFRRNAPLVSSSGYQYPATNLQRFEIWHMNDRRVASKQQVATVFWPAGSPGWSTDNKNHAVMIGVDDFDGDGRADALVWSQQKGTNKEYYHLLEFEYHQPGGVSDVRVREIALAQVSISIVCVADFNGDGFGDYVRADGSPGYIHYSVAFGKYSTSTNFNDHFGTKVKFFSQPTTDKYRIRECGDFNGDYRADLLWQEEIPLAERATRLSRMYITHLNVGKTQLYFNQYSNPYITGYSILPSSWYEWRPQGAGDFDGDGVTDIAWLNMRTSEVVIWTLRRDGQGASIKAGYGGSVGYQSSGWMLEGP